MTRAMVLMYLMVFGGLASYAVLVCIFFVRWSEMRRQWVESRRQADDVVAEAEEILREDR